MRKLFLLTLLGLAGTAAHAQTPLTKGRGLVTGSINYHYQSAGPYYGASSQAFSFAPAAGYFVADNVLVGLSLGVQSASYAPTDYIVVGLPPQYRTSSFSVGPFMRYYQFVGGDKFALYGQGGLGYLHVRGAYASSANQGYLTVAPGLAFFPVPRFGIEASLQGITLATNFNHATTLDLGVSLQNLQLGVAYYFGK